MDHPFVFRPGTNDEAMFRHLTSHDEYRLPESFGPEEIVVDIGVHIGSFCYSALGRGARRVVGFEAEPSNYECAARNLASYGDRVRLHNRAVWRSDVPASRLVYASSTDAGNTGGGGMFFGEAEGRPVREVRPVAFDEAILEATDGGARRIRFLKIDCEGSEFPILLTARRLDLVDEIAGEFHELGCARNPQEIPAEARVAGVPEFTVEALAAALEKAGFVVTWQRAEPGSSLGLFFATRGRKKASLGGRLRSFWNHLTHRAPASGAA